jgi:hypothetical protein
VDIEGLSDQSLLDLHSLIAQALAIDDALPANQKRFGVRQYPDWRRQSDAFEAEMTRRALTFTPIHW